MADFYDPKNPLGIRPKENMSPFAPDTRRPGLLTSGLFPTSGPQISSNGRPSRGGFIDPRNPLGFPASADPYQGIFGQVNVDVGPRAGSSIERYYDQLMKLMPTPRQQGLGDIGSILGGFAGDQRTNRVIQGNAYQTLDQMMMQREAAKNQVGQSAQTDFDRSNLLSRADKRDANKQAMQDVQLGGWLQQGGNADKPGGAHRAVSDQEKAAATGLIQQAHNNLTDPGYQPTKFEGDWSYQPRDPNTYAKPGIMERIGQYGGLASGLLGGLDGLSGGNKVSNWLGDMGKYGALGAKLGSFVPGIGNAVGAGIGAGFGGIKKLFGF